MKSAPSELKQRLLPTAKHAPENLGRVLVLGLGKSGCASAAYCQDLLGKRVDELVIAAGIDNEASRSQAKAFLDQGIPVIFGESLDGGLGRFDLCIASPGIPQFGAFYQSALGLADELVSEVEFAWRESAASSRWLAITGTNGKTTTTALAAHILKSCGFKAAAVGNIGDTCIKAVSDGDVECYVAELSSYQLASTRLFAPDVAVLLNITPDHLAWHKGMDNYIQAKTRIYANLARTQGMVVMDATNDIVRSLVREMRAQTPTERGFLYIPLGTQEGIYSDMRERCGSDNAAFIDDTGVLCVALGDGIHRLAAQESLQIPGEHNASNALAAAAACVAFGAPDEGVAAALASFAPLEHRLEPCGEVGSVACYNDSKATNVDATLKALAAFTGKRVVVLFGGQDKGTELTELARATRANCEAAVCYGEAGPRFAEALTEAGVPIRRAKGMEEALDDGLELADGSGILLLSPACASFDEFSNFEERGEVFKRLVAERARKAGS